MPFTRRLFLIAACLISPLVGCAPNAGNTAAATNPWAQPGSSPTQTSVSPPPPTDSSYWSFLSELRRRSDQQQALADAQRRNLEALIVQQREQEQRSRIYATEQQERDRRALAQRYATQEQKILGSVDRLQGRARDLDVNNRDLHAVLARSEQSRKILQDEIDLLKRRLEDTTQQLTQAQQFGQETDRRLQALQASTRRRAGATITANSSLKRDITAVMVPGMDIRQDGDLVRISIPADKLFMAGTATLHQGSQSYMDQVARVILDHYPRQIAGVEAHTDQGTTLANTQWRNQHQLTAAQSMAVFEQLTARNINEHQLFVLGHGSNHPLVSDGTSQGQAVNRRVEIVIYPETYAQK